MLFSLFEKKTLEFWGGYLRNIQKHADNGTLSSGDGYPLFPSLLLFIDCGEFYVAEFIGASRRFAGLATKRHKSTIYTYFNHFYEEEFGQVNPGFVLNASKNSFRNISFTTEAATDAAIARFPFVNLFNTKIQLGNALNCAIGFGDEFQDCSMHNCAIVNEKNGLVRCKNILSLFIVRKSISPKDLSDIYSHYAQSRELILLHTVNNENVDAIMSGGHFQTLYLMPGLRETTIGEYLRLTPEIAKIAFKASELLYEPSFEWIEHDGTVDEESINPDFMLRRSDGFYDIYDLKTAAMNRNSLTKGPRNRRRFIDYVNEGAAQLSNYRRYFEYEGNRDFAKRKYQIDVKDPKLTLVVGSWDNANAQEIAEASKMLNMINIIDYDTFVHLFLGSEKNHDFLLA